MKKYSVVPVVALALLTCVFIQKATAADKSAGGCGSMVSVKGGCFDMGDTFGEGGNDEKPVHRVCLDDFKLDACEVTNAEFEKWKPDFEESRKAVSDNKKVSFGDKQPVVEVTWHEADGYCKSVGKRLPTEAEWEYAAHSGGKKEKYATSAGELDHQLANYESKKTTPVGSFAPNALGLYDMAGNVWEWVNDWYDKNYYSGSPEKNPKGPSSGSVRVLRGGSWYSDPSDLRVSARRSTDPTYRIPFYGFRCAQ